MSLSPQVILTIIIAAPIAVYLLIVKSIAVLTPKSNLKLTRLVSYFDFLTFRGIAVLTSALVLIYIGNNNQIRIDAFILGVFLISLISINLLICTVLRLGISIRRKKIEISFSNEIYYADQPIKISRFYIPLISRLIYIFPTKVSIFLPERLGEDIEFELNKEILKNPEILLPISKRGIYEIGPMIISFNDFFGLVQTKFFYSKKEKIKVYPYFENLFHIKNKFLDRSFRDFKQTRMIINDDNFFDIKEYNPHDDMRRINWKQTARTDDKILVKKPESINLNIQNSITMFLDNSFVGVNNDAVYNAFDKQISIAATLGNFYFKNGSKVKLCYLGKNNSLITIKSADMYSFLDTLCALDFNHKSNTNSNSFMGNIASLKEENLVYIYNSLTNQFRYESSKDIVKNICVDVKSFVRKSMKSKSRKFYKLFFTNEYFALKNKGERENAEFIKHIENKNVELSRSVILVKSSDSLGKVLAG